MHSPVKRHVLLAAALTVPFLSVTALVRAEEPCSAYPTGTAEKIESVDLEKTFGAVPAPKKAASLCLCHQDLDQRILARRFGWN